MNVPVVSCIDMQTIFFLFLPIVKAFGFWSPEDTVEAKF